MSIPSPSQSPTIGRQPAIPAPKTKRHIGAARRVAVAKVEQRVLGIIESHGCHAVAVPVAHQGNPGGDGRAEARTPRRRRPTCCCCRTTNVPVAGSYQPGPTLSTCGEAVPGSVAEGDFAAAFPLIFTVNVPSVPAGTELPPLSTTWPAWIVTV